MSAQARAACSSASGRAARVIDERVHVIEQRGRDMDRLRLMLELRQLFTAQGRAELFQEIAAVLAAEELALGVRAGVTELDAHEKTIELRLG
jgi:hypothetical protein